MAFNNVVWPGNVKFLNRNAVKVFPFTFCVKFSSPGNSEFIVLCSFSGCEIVLGFLYIQINPIRLYCLLGQLP